MIPKVLIQYECEQPQIEAESWHFNLILLLNETVIYNFMDWSTEPNKYLTVLHAVIAVVLRLSNVSIYHEIENRDSFRLHKLNITLFIRHDRCI